MQNLQIAKLENTDLSCWDFSMLKAELQNKLDFYANLVYTDETIKSAKNDRTTLSKVKKTIEDARKAYKASCLAPYEAIEPKIKELVDMVEKQRILIDEIVKDYETRQKEAKEIEVRRYYDRKAVVLGTNADVLYQKLLDKKWINASTARTKYEESIMAAINSAAADLAAIRATKSPFIETLLEIYVDTLSMERVKEKQSELEAAAQKASLTTIEEAAAVISTSLPVTVNAPQITVNSDTGTVLKVYASQNQINQIFDFMRAIGVRYELL